MPGRIQLSKGYMLPSVTNFDADTLLHRSVAPATTWVKRKGLDLGLFRIPTDVLVQT